MKSEVLSLLFVFLSLNGLGQIILKGNVHDSNARPLEGVNVIISNKTNDDILNYGTTNNQGNFIITCAAYIDSLNISLSAIGYEKQTISLTKKGNHFVDITLKLAVNNLKEVIVKTTNNPVKAKGDTISYNVKSFADSSDRVIIDIIKKLPGIKVTNTGQILYNNKAINKFYIEGKDLLDNRYNVATNNLPSADVEQIQVIEDHQPIRILESTTPSDRAAINIRLKENAKLRLLGNGQIGIGIKPYLRDDDLSILKFSKELQFINTLKTNSTGINLDQELNQQYFSSNYYDSGSSKQDLVTLVTPAKPPIDQERYWFNNNNLFSGNYLFSFNKFFDLKVNTAFETDIVLDNPATNTNIYLPKDTIRINEDHSERRSYSKLLTGLTLMANNKNYYLNDNLRYEQIWSSGTDFISAGQINQQLNNPFQNFTNDLSGLVNIGKNLFGFTSYTVLNNLPQTLNILPGLYPDILNAGQPFNGLLQQVKMHNIFTNNSFKYVRKSGLINIINSAGVILKDQVLGNILFKTENEIKRQINSSYQDTIKRLRLEIYDEFGLSIIKENFNASLSLKTSFNSLKSRSDLLDRYVQKLLIEPQFFVHYNISNSFSNNLTVAISNALNDNTNQSYILTDYRTFINNNSPINQTINSTISYQLGYKNIVRGLFSNLNLIYTHIKSNVLTVDQYDSLLTIRNYINYQNYANYVNAMLNISKYWLPIKTTLDIAVAYEFNASEQLLQGALVHFRDNEYSINSKIITNISSYLVLTHTTNFTLYKNTSIQNENKMFYQPVFAFKQELTAKVFLPLKTQLTGKVEQYYNSTGSINHSSEALFDIGLQKSVTKYKIDYSITALNILDVKNYTSYTYSNNILTTANYPLRGRMILLKVAFQF